MRLWTCNHSQPFGEKLRDDGQQSGQSNQQTWDWLKTIRDSVLDIFKHDSSLPPITFSFFAVINCNNIQQRWRVGWVRRDLMRPKMLDFTATVARQSLLLETFFIHSFYSDLRRNMDEYYYYAWNLFFPVFFLPFSRSDFFHQGLTKRGSLPPTWRMINHKLFTSLHVIRGLILQNLFLS